MLFLQLAISHIAVNHLSRPMGESSKMVPILSENLADHDYWSIATRDQPVLRHGCHLITPQAMRAPPPPSGAGASE